MNRIKEFIKSTVVGGLLVVLPLAIFVLPSPGCSGLVSSGISPLAEVIMANSPLDQSLVVDVIVIVLIIAVCFVIGALVRTKVGKWLYATIEAGVLLKVPGYSLIKETVSQFLGNKESPFSSVALVQIFGNETYVSAFVTDKHQDGSYTVFVPTGPNPTSGNIYHLPGKHVHPVKVPVEDAMRSIISCGAGSTALVSQITRE